MSAARAPLLAAAAAALAASIVAPGAARAGAFDGQGNYLRDPGAVAFVDFAHPERYFPTGTDKSCAPPGYHLVTAAEDALEGEGYVRLRVAANCSERFALELPTERGSYRATVWMRHGSLDAQMVVLYPDGFGLDTVVTARFGPTGRTTSDGWVELATNEFPVDGTLATNVYLRVTDSASQAGVDVDALELTRQGAYLPQRACAGRYDGTCSDEEACIFNRCELGREAVPPLPDEAMRAGAVDALESRVRLFFGGHRSRELYLAGAMRTFEQMRTARTAWQFWNTWATAVHRLHDWHTITTGDFANYYPSRRLNACFFEGDADLSHAAWPRDPRFADVLVSYAGAEAAGLHAGDRLVAVDGLHPFEWVASLVDVDWGSFVATDPDVYAEYAERLGGPSWAGGALILEFATSFTVLRCDAEHGTCSDLPETIRVADLPAAGPATDLNCDNRPSYHLGKNSPDATKHDVSITGNFYQGPIDGTTPEEAIYGMVWDNLDGGGDPNSVVNATLSGAVAAWKASARGVILDHRAGNGGTIDTGTVLTALVRPPETVAVLRIPIQVGGYGGPSTPAEGLAQFNQFASASGYQVGDPSYDPTLPVALLTHRDGSASDYMPFAMKGSPRVRLFGPHATAGAFSTYHDLNMWAGMQLQIASGDTIAADGSTLIGHGVTPDVVIEQRQSDLLAGKDTLFEAALAWVRKELKP